MARQARQGRTGAQARRPAPRRKDARRRPGLLMRLGLLVVFAIAVLAVARIAGCRLPGRVSYSESVSTGVDASELYQSPYDWGNLLQDSAGRYTYVSGGQVLSRTGVDVSEHQGQIDWSAVAGDGIEFAIIRRGYRGSDNGRCSSHGSRYHSSHGSGCHSSNGSSDGGGYHRRDSSVGSNRGAGGRCRPVSGFA